MRNLSPVALVASLLLPTLASADVSSGCRAAMEQGLSGYAGCRLLAFSKDSRRPDATKLADSLATCRARFEAAMYKAPAVFGRGSLTPPVR